MDDLISRQAAIEAIEEMQIPIMRSIFPEEQFVFKGMSEALSAIKDLPSVQPVHDCDTCRYNNLEWDEEPCDSCTMGGESNHWKPSAQRWIPCSERLPEVHESGNSFSGIYMQSVPVLVYGICEGEENAQFHVVTYCDDLDGNTYWSTELDALTITEVKEWMPLPEPYKGEQE